MPQAEGLATAKTQGQEPEGHGATRETDGWGRGESAATAGRSLLGAVALSMHSGSTSRAINCHLQILSRKETLWSEVLGSLHLTDEKLRLGEVLGAVCGHTAGREVAGAHTQLFPSNHPGQSPGGPVWRNPHHRLSLRAAVKGWGCWQGTPVPPNHGTCDAK